MVLYKPAGVPARQLQTIELGLDELEALRLADLEGLYHDAAAVCMGVSRPTFSRLILRARQKTATALLNGHLLLIKGGTVMVTHMRTFECQSCHQQFQLERGGGRPRSCPDCGGKDVYRLSEPVDLSGRPAHQRLRQRGQIGCRRRRGMNSINLSTTTGAEVST